MLESLSDARKPPERRPREGKVSRFEKGTLMAMGHCPDRGGPFRQSAVPKLRDHHISVEPSLRQLHGLRCNR